RGEWGQLSGQLPGFLQALPLRFGQLHEQRRRIRLEPSEETLDILGRHRRAARRPLPETTPDVEEDARAGAPPGVDFVLPDDESLPEETVLAEHLAPAFPGDGRGGKRTFDPLVVVGRAHVLHAVSLALYAAIGEPRRRLRRRVDVPERRPEREDARGR